MDEAHMDTIEDEREVTDDGDGMEGRAQAMPAGEDPPSGREADVSESPKYEEGA
jgi:hypothetical protein